jgi:membrane associated rhomboid family serine protease
VREQAGPVSANVKRAVKVNARSMKAMDMPVTKIIIAINAVIFVFTEFLKTNPTLSKDNLLLYGPAVSQGELWRIVSSGFLHLGVIHIGFNMYILFQLGRTFENSIGKARFIGLYAASLVGGSAGALLLEPKVPVGGASGAVFGLAGAAVVALRQRGVRFSQTQWGPMLVINLVLTFANKEISKGGHLGGLLFGAVAGAIILNPKIRGRDFAKDLGVLAALTIGGFLLAYYLAKNPMINKPSLFTTNG